MWDLENRLDQWVGKCPLYYIRKYTGSPINFRYILEECINSKQELVTQEVSVLQSIQFQRYTSYYNYDIT